MRRWVVDAIRTGLTHEPQFSMSEIETLGESNYQLFAIGRNLNQIVRRLNEGQYEPITVERIKTLNRLIDKHTNAVSDVIRASLERWSAGASNVAGVSEVKCPAINHARPPSLP